MTVYVDSARIPYKRGMLMNHLVADSVEELLAFADLLGLKRSWYQTKPIPHFDICWSMRTRALRLGAQAITRREMGHQVRKWKLKAVPLGAEQAVARGEDLG